MIVGVTGSIGSGKSTVCKILAATLGAELISSDELCRRELLPGKAGLVAVERRWKRRFLSGSGELDRPALRIAALEEPEVLSELEESFLWLKRFDGLITVLTTQVFFAVLLNRFFGSVRLSEKPEYLQITK